MELETAAAAIEKDPDDEQNAHDSSSTTGKKADEDQQIQLAIGATNWYRSTQALKYLQPVVMPIVMNEMKSLHLQSMNDFGRKLCAEATADDIRPVNGWLAQFKHLCPGTLVACQNLLNIIKGHTSDSVNFYKMLKGTDPQQWLKSPFEFVRLFLKDWMRCDIHDFQECDITALCTIVKRCKPLMQIFDERKIDELRYVRNRTMHPATMSISQEEMENNIDVILDFLQHIKSLKSTDEVTEAIESIKQLRTGDARLLHSMVVNLIQGWLPGARIAYEHNSDKAKNQLQDIMYMETILATLSSGKDITQSAGLEFGAKKEENRETEKLKKLKELKERLQKQQEENRELEQQNKKLQKQQEENRKLEEQNKKLHKENRELEKRKEELLNRLRRPLWSWLFSARTPPDLGISPATVCTDVSTIPIKSDKDKGPCHITGMVAISGTQLMLADESNKCIKLLDLERGTVIGVKELPSAPHDVTYVPWSRVAVTIPAFNEIHVFTADKNFKQCGIMGVDGICFGIHCSGDRFFVSCKKPTQVQILNMDGDIIKTIQLSPFEYPRYLTCSPDNKFIYVSHFYNNIVTCMDMAGSRQWRYSYGHYNLPGLAFPQGVCTGDGCIYICSFDEIHVVSPTGTKLAVIPFSLKGVKNAAVCYSSKERTLYVSRFSSVAEENTYINRIRVHQHKCIKKNQARAVLFFVILGITCIFLQVMKDTTNKS